MRPLLLAAVLLLGSTGGPAAQSQCSRELLHVRGTPLSVSLCVAAPPAVSGSVVTLRVSATYAASGSSFMQTANVRFITGEGPARALDSVDLHRVGISGSLHMTLLYANNLVTIEHAILTPGALTIK
jgi:hypothetical protein